MTIEEAQRLYDSELAAAELADRRRYSPTFADEVRASEIMGTAFGPAE